MPKAKGARGNGRPSLGGSKTAPPKKDDHATLAELGVSMRDKGQGFAGADIRSIAPANREAIQRPSQTQQMAFYVMRCVHDSQSGLLMKQSAVR